MLNEGKYSDQERCLTETGASKKEVVSDYPLTFNVKQFRVQFYLLLPLGWSLLLLLCYDLRTWEFEV